MKNEKIDVKKKAVALQYKLGYTAPKVVATGAGHMAHKILEAAKDANVRLYEDAKLVQELSRLDLGMDIPPELYQVVAQILVYVDKLDALEGMKSYEQYE